MSKRVKFTTTLRLDTIEKLQHMAPSYLTKNLNVVIEKIIDEKWSEEKWNGYGQIHQA